MKMIFFRTSGSGGVTFWRLMRATYPFGDCGNGGIFLAGGDASEEAIAAGEMCDEIFISFIKFSGAAG